ncbi:MULTISPECIES: hypothetical protein [Streptococcus anginosus group]|uniref:hypothetical protein n=1 Tax=Streptococcus anginosus group TaxID=671232 RepID=UPI000A579741|nr:MULTISPECIES: hypothetical protein [Streptococcus anginosus group]
MKTIEGGGSREIVMNVDEMQAIMRYITTVEISFQNNLAPKLKSLSETKYYEGGEASKAMEHYTKMLNKVNEVGDLYRRANSEILNMMGQWLEQDKKLKEDFVNSLSSNPALVNNLESLGMIRGEA